MGWYRCLICGLGQRSGNAAAGWAFHYRRHHYEPPEEATK